MGRTIVKQVRVTRDEAERARNLLDYFPECATEAEVLRLLLLRGLVLTEAEFIAGGAIISAHPSLEKLTAMVLPRVLPLLQLLGSRDVLQWPLADGDHASRISLEQRSPQDVVVDPEAVRDLLALGTSEL